MARMLVLMVILSAAAAAVAGCTGTACHGGIIEDIWLSLSCEPTAPLSVHVECPDPNASYGPSMTTEGVRVEMLQDGTCHVAVVFSDGESWQSDVTFGQRSEACHYRYIDSSNGYVIPVPEPLCKKLDGGQAE
jgi:hypothetical protein